MIASKTSTLHLLNALALQNSDNVETYLYAYDSTKDPEYDYEDSFAKVTSFSAKNDLFNFSATCLRNIILHDISGEDLHKQVYRTYNIIKYGKSNYPKLYIQPTEYLINEFPTLFTKKIIINCPTPKEVYEVVLAGTEDALPILVEDNELFGEEVLIQSLEKEAYYLEKASTLRKIVKGYQLEGKESKNRMPSNIHHDTSNTKPERYADPEQVQNVVYELKNSTSRTVKVSKSEVDTLEKAQDALRLANASQRYYKLLSRICTLHAELFGHLSWDEPQIMSRSGKKISCARVNENVELKRTEWFSEV